MDDKILEEIVNLQDKVELFEKELKEKIYSICNKLDYVNSSRFGRSIDRLEQFSNDIINFKIIKLNNG
jgi:hypothetical protein